MKTVMLVDADIISYRCAAVAEKRVVLVKHQSGATKEFKNKTEFRNSLKEKGRPEREVEYKFEEIQKDADRSLMISTIRSTISKIQNCTFVDQSEFYLSGRDDNFRLNLPLPKQYKSNRENTIRPLLLKEAKRYILDEYHTFVARKIEADDILNIRAYEEIAKGNEAIIASSDKDTLQSEGVKFFDFTQENPVLFDIPEIGDVRMKGPVLKGEGLKFFASQLLIGDNADYYFPTDICGARYGAKSAFKDLQHLMFADEILDFVISKYKEWYGSPTTYTAWDGVEHTKTWDEILSLYFQAAYMKRTWNDPSDWKAFFRSRGVNLEKHL